MEQNMIISRPATALEVPDSFANNLAATANKVIVVQGN